MDGTDEQAIEALRAQAGSSAHITPRRLLALGGYERRGDRVVRRVYAWLRAADVTTEPYWATSHIDSALRLLTRSDTETTDAAEQNQDVLTDTLPVGLRVASVRSATNRPLGVKATDSVKTAITRMASHHFSQLPVFDDSMKHIVGAITWESIALNMYRQLVGVADAMSADPPPLVSAEASLVSTVPMIVEHGFVLVQDRGDVIGIVTSSDLAESLAALAQPFLMIGDIERQLRHLAQQHVTFASCGVRPRFLPRDADGNGREPEGYDDLGFNELSDVFQRNWTLLPWMFDQMHFKDRLDEVRLVRNEVMHFRPDPPSADTLVDLHNIARWLRQLR